MNPVQWLTAMFRAGRLLYSVGGIDLAGTLAYFTILALLPLVALVVIAVSIFTDPAVMQERLADALAYFFPASRELLRRAVVQLFSGSLTLGLIALVGLAISANGLFMAANRSVNRVFGIEHKKPVGAMITEVVVGTILLFLFTFAIGATILIRFAVSFAGMPAALVILTQTISGLSAVVLTGVVLAVMYHHLPNRRVTWKDAAFGGVVAVLLFEAGKQFFFWFTAMASERSAIYGPVASFVILLMWAYIVGLIFLYGAALTRCVAEVRRRRFS